MPASRPELFSKALAGQADAVSFDLEDAVEESQKPAARHELQEFFKRQAGSVQAKVWIVRVNAVSTAHFLADLKAVVHPSLAVLNLPMVESADEVRHAASLLAELEAQRGMTTPVQILANIESPRGLRLAADIACSDSRLMGLQLGFGDLFSPLGIDPTDQAACHSVMMAVRLAAGEAGINAYDGAYPHISDLAGFARSAMTAARLGFAGKSCIHPSQVASANQSFRPSQDDIDHALRVVAAAREKRAEGVGAFVVDGKLLDGPLIAQAQAIVKQARKLHLIEED